MSRAAASVTACPAAGLGFILLHVVIAAVRACFIDSGPRFPSPAVRLRVVAGRRICFWLDTAGTDPVRLPRARCRYRTATRRQPSDWIPPPCWERPRGKCLQLHLAGQHRSLLVVQKRKERYLLQKFRITRHGRLLFN